MPEPMVVTGYPICSNTSRVTRVVEAMRADPSRKFARTEDERIRLVLGLLLRGKDVSALVGKMTVRDAHDLDACVRHINEKKVQQNTQSMGFIRM